MYLLGSFVGQQFTRAADQDDLDFFPFPEIDPTIGAGLASTRRSTASCCRRSPKNEDGAKKLLALPRQRGRGEHLPRDRPERHRVRTSTADTAQLQRAAEEGRRARSRGAKHIAQFLDRDTRPDFASTVMIPSLQTFLEATPTTSTGLTKSIESQKKTIFARELALRPSATGSAHRRSRRAARREGGGRPAALGTTGRRRA